MAHLPCCCSDRWQLTTPVWHISHVVALTADRLLHQYGTSPMLLLWPLTAYYTSMAHLPCCCSNRWQRTTPVWHISHVVALTADRLLHQYGTSPISLLWTADSFCNIITNWVRLKKAPACLCFTFIRITKTIWNVCGSTNTGKSFNRLRNKHSLRTWK